MPSSSFSVQSLLMFWCIAVLLKTPRLQSCKKAKRWCLDYPPRPLPNRLE